MPAAGQQAPIPEIDGQETFDALVRKLAVYFTQAIETPHTFEELRTTFFKQSLRPLVRHLTNEVHHPAIVSALLALKGHYATAESDDDRGINATRGLACELVAWRFVTHLSERDSIDFLCYSLPTATAQKDEDRTGSPSSADDGPSGRVTEQTPLLRDSEVPQDESFNEEDPNASAELDRAENASSAVYVGLTALEIAAVCNAKKFLSQKAVRRILDGIWKGDIVFWEKLSTYSTKEARTYNPKRSDPFCRLRVPLYLKIFEVFFFAAFLAFYYTVLVQKPFDHVTFTEILLYVWLAAFTYNELVEFWDAGGIFYVADFWSFWDLGIIATGLAFLVTRMVGLAREDHQLIDTAFDILSVEALFLVPRICSLLSLHPYFGTLIPCLREMTKDFIKFLGLVAILYLGFNTTFAFLARGTFSFRKMSWILIKVFFGSSYLGFDVAEEISPILGPPLMFIFVCLTNILLITSLISLLSNSLTKVMEHARDEYLFVYAVYVLEASTSNRLTYFLPPLNLVALLLRPLRLIVPAANLRTARIILLKITHWPFVALILSYERGQLYLTRQRKANASSASSTGRPSAPPSLRRPFAGISRQQLVAAGTGRPSLDEQARGGKASVAKRPRDPTAVAETTTEGLERLADSLRSQLEHVSLLIRQEMQRTSSNSVNR